MTNIITYIDGFNLYHGIKSKYGRKYYWLNVEQLSENLLQSNQNLVQVKYFTAMIGNNPPKEKRQKTYISALKTLAKMPGRYVGKEAAEDNGVPFEEKMSVLTTQLTLQFARGNLKEIGYDF